MRTGTKIIGIAGKKRHGKDVLAAVLGSHGKVVRIAFADELKRYAMQLWDLSFEQLYGSDRDKETVDPRWGLTPRFIMQQFGTEVGRNIHAETWVRKVMTAIDRGSHGDTVTLPDLEARQFREFRFKPGTVVAWAIPDVRFPTEADAIKSAGGIIVKVIRPLLVSNDTHASETDVDKIVANQTVLNVGTLEEFETQVHLLAARIL